MKLRQTTTVLALTLFSFVQPASAIIEIWSGHKELNTNVDGCVGRAERLIQSQFDNLVEVGRGDFHRTGYFQDGSYRIVCFANGSGSTGVIFVAHEDLDVATQFGEILLNEL
ncbi:MAG TPA: hypothetical protein DCL61_00120 [Cyanobacteria bacterium UBA12227]|nr:hypothetical protein [Cyanobacteria bacterium UBA12227]HAX87469.1 hypothetical protein [Cyanobacteria bacterium UBA11370]HBY79798.1 hypothetical protein [Cyanobacteria bacterium UBA11148]